MSKKQITNLCITGITTCGQMRKLAKLTGTKIYTGAVDETWENDYGAVHFGSLGYLDYTSKPKKNLKHLTWEQFLAKYDKPCCKDELKRVKKELKALKKVPFHTDQLEDKQLVWYWDDISLISRRLGFWDKRHLGVFHYTGCRRGDTWDNYEPYKGKVEKWMKEARKKLQD